MRTSLRFGAVHRRSTCGALWLASALLLLGPSGVDASFLHGETLDSVADAIAWAVLVIAPIVGIAVFWLVHILPEKVAEKKRHPQAKAIQTLCLLSLFFGGLLWPLAWLWAYSKPVFYRAAYGTDMVEPDHGESGESREALPAPAPAQLPAPSSASASSPDDMNALRRRLVELEAKLKGTGKAAKV